MNNSNSAGPQKGAWQDLETQCGSGIFVMVGGTPRNGSVASRLLCLRACGGACSFQNERPFMLRSNIYVLMATITSAAASPAGLTAHLSPGLARSRWKVDVSFRPSGGLKTFWRVLVSKCRNLESGLRPPVESEDLMLIRYRDFTRKKTKTKWIVNTRF